MTPDFSTPRVYRNSKVERVETGVGALNNLPKLLQKLGATRIVIATSNSILTKTDSIDRVRALLGTDEVAVYPRCRQHSPESDIVELQEVLASNDADAVVSIGGSSIFDTVKIAIGRSSPNGASPIPQIAIPTTLSAGEFTPGAGYTDEATQTKKLVLDYRMTPRFVILDAEVTIDTPEALWLSSGVKALDHALEAVWAIHPHPYGDALALEAIRLLFEYLPKSRDGDLDARGACQFAAWMAISGAAAAGMRLSHFLGHQVGARLHIPHGVTSCILLPPVMRHLRDQTLQAQGRVAVAMGLERGDRSPEQFADAAADRLEQFIAGLGLPTSLKAAGGNAADVDAITSSSFEAAQGLGLASDLPEGAETIRKILLSA